MKQTISQSRSKVAALQETLASPSAKQQLAAESARLQAVASAAAPRKLPKDLEEGVENDVTFSDQNAVPGEEMRDVILAQAPAAAVSAASAAAPAAAAAAAVAPAAAAAAVGISVGTLAAIGAGVVAVSAAAGSGSSSASSGSSSELTGDILLNQTEFKDFLASTKTVAPSGRVQVTGSLSTAEVIDLGTLARNIGAETLILGNEGVSPEVVEPQKITFKGVVFSKLATTDDTVEFTIGGDKVTVNLTKGNDEGQTQTNLVSDFAAKGLNFSVEFVGGDLVLTADKTTLGIDSAKFTGLFQFKTGLAAAVTEKLEGDPGVESIDSFKLDLGASGFTTIVLNGTGNHDVTSVDGLIETFVISAMNDGDIVLRNLEAGDKVKLLADAGQDSGFTNLAPSAAAVDGKKSSDNTDLFGEWNFTAGVLTYWAYDLEAAMSVNLEGVSSVTQDTSGVFVIA